MRNLTTVLKITFLIMILLITNVAFISAISKAVISLVFICIVIGSCERGHKPEVLGEQARRVRRSKPGVLGGASQACWEEQGRRVRGSKPGL